MVSGYSAEADAHEPAAQEASSDLQDALRGLEHLTDEQRRVLLLVVLEGFDYSEVAKILQIPIGTVMSRLSRGRDRLRNFLDGRERPTMKRVK